MDLGFMTKFNRSMLGDTAGARKGSIETSPGIRVFVSLAPGLSVSI